MPTPSKVKPTGEGHAKAWIIPKSRAVAPIAAFDLLFLLTMIIKLETKMLKSNGIKAWAMCILNWGRFSIDLSLKANEKALYQSLLN